MLRSLRATVVPARLLDAAILAAELRLGQDTRLKLSRDRIRSQ